mgnify:CR=1 FL=1
MGPFGGWEAGSPPPHQTGQADRLTPYKGEVLLVNISIPQNVTSDGPEDPTLTLQHAAAHPDWSGRLRGGSAPLPGGSGDCV